MRRWWACFVAQARRDDGDGGIDALIGDDSTSDLLMRETVSPNPEPFSRPSLRSTVTSASRAVDDAPPPSEEPGDVPSPSSMPCCISMCPAKYPIVVNGVVFDAAVLASYIRRTFDTKNPVTRTELSMRDAVDVDALSDSGGAVFEVFCNPWMRRDHLAHESTVAYLEREIRLLDSEHDLEHNSEHPSQDAVVTALVELRGFDVLSYNALLPALSNRVQKLCAHPHASAR